MVADTPSIAVVITTYDERPQYLREAIQSVVSQTLAPAEIIVVDDGSRVDNAPVFGLFPFLRVIRQENQGLPAARNAGWRAATSTYVVFLDSDDRLTPDALATNLRRFAKAPDCAFVYGAYRFIDRDGTQSRDVAFRDVGPDPYVTMLRGNPIGMHATVMYRRDRLAEAGGFDPTYRACEDYELYLRLTRRHPVASDPKVVAEYRQHGGNMSNDIPLMLRSALRALRAQRIVADEGDTRRLAREEGLRGWKSFYVHQQLTRMRESVRQKRIGELSLADGARVFVAAPATTIAAATRDLRALLPRQAVRFGDLRRTTPISRHFGFDRGIPIDRRYIEAFLRAHTGDVRGRVLEIGDNAYTIRFGGQRVTQSDVLHVHAGAPNATFVSDLESGESLPSDAFDCIILTQTLHLVFDMPKAIATLHRILKPGGVLLATAPGVSSVDTGEWGDTWYWSLTPASLGRLLRRKFDSRDVEVAASGNVLTAIAFLHGLAQDELLPDDFEPADPHYPVIVMARARKGSDGPTAA